VADQSGLAHSFFWRIQLARQEGSLERVRSVATRVTADCGFELVDAEMKRAADGLLVRLYVDKPGGIGLTTQRSGGDSAILDAEDLIEGRYTEVFLARPRPAAQDGGRLPPLVGRLAKLELRAGRAAATGRLIVAARRSFLSSRRAREARPSRRPHGRLEVEFPRHG
jgi:hypothetical protein